MKLQLCVVTHPNLEKGFILSNVSKSEKFIKNNVKTWYMYGLDPKLFKIEKYSVKDKILAEGLLETLPELFL